MEDCPFRCKLRCNEIFKITIMGALIEIRKSQKAGQDLTSWFGIILGSVRQDKRTRKLTNLNSLLTTYIKSWKEVTEKQHITFEYTCDNVQFKCYPYEIESILTNLIVNSVTSFKRYKCDNPKIIIDINAISGEYPFHIQIMGMV